MFITFHLYINSVLISSFPFLFSFPLFLSSFPFLVHFLFSKQMTTLQKVSTTLCREIMEIIGQGPTIGSSVQKSLKIEVKKAGTITPALIVKQNCTCIKVRTYDCGFVLLMMNNFTKLDIDFNHRCLTLVINKVPKSRRY